MGYAFKGKINPRGKTARQIEKEADYIMNYVRGRRACPWSRGDYGVHRPRKPKGCYCGGHSVGKGTLDSHSELNRWWTRRRRNAKNEMKMETERLYNSYGSPANLFAKVYYREVTGAETGKLPEAVL